MPVQVSYPGVYVQEVPSGVRTITGVSTSVALFIGMTKRGQLDTPRRVLSFVDYVRAFGDDTTQGEMTDQVRQFFLNGGQQAFIMRIANGAVAGGVDLKDERSNKKVLKLTARDAGTDGSTIRVEVDYDTPTPESSFNVRVFRLAPDGQGGFNETEQEVFQNLTMNPGSGLFAVDVITQTSKLVNADRGDDVINDNDLVKEFKGYALSGRLFDTTVTDGAAGALKTALGSAIDATGPGGAGGFRISVDRNTFVDVVLKKDELPAGAADVPAFLQTEMKNALTRSGVGASVSVSLIPGAADRNYLRVQSDKAGGSVAFRSATTADISGAMHLGLERGGFEVDGYAKQRPAPTGLFFRPGDFEGAPVVDALTNLAGRDQTDITTYQLHDSAGSHSFTGVNFGSGGKMYAKAGEPDSLKNVEERLQLFAAKINSDAIADAHFNWTAAVHGHRLVLTPKFGNANNAAVTFKTGAVYDLGADKNGMDVPNVRYYSLGTTGTANNYQAPGLAGFDGSIPKPKDYSDALEVIDRQVDLFNLMILPRARDDTNAQSDSDREQLWGPASTFCLSRRALLLMDPRSDGGKWSTADEVDSQIADLRIGLVKDHAAIYWPRVLVGANGRTKPIDPSGSIAGLMARIDSTRGVWKAPAGVDADIRGIRGVEYSMSDPENGVINPQAVNAIRVFPTGIVSWGARTMDGFENSGNLDYKYVPVRRLALFIEESLLRGLKFAVFQPNDEPLWGQIRLAAGSFMNSLFRQGAFQGQRARDAYFVKVDSETTTQNDINLGIVNVVVGFAPLKPAEFVIITVQQMAGQVQT
jgi:phage tail sheath protein FI